VTEGPLQDMTVTCKQCQVAFVFTKGKHRFGEGEKRRNQRDARNAANRFVESERKQPGKIDSTIIPLGLNSKLQKLHGPFVKDGGQKLETLMKEVGCKHEERSTSN